MFSLPRQKVPWAPTYSSAQVHSGSGRACGLGFPVWPGGRDTLPACASRPPPLPPPSSFPFQRHYKSNSLERKASKILKPSSIINADSKSPLRAFYIATVTKTRWWGCGSSPPHPTALGGIAAEPGPARLPPGHPPAFPRSRGVPFWQGKQFPSC